MTILNEIRMNDDISFSLLLSMGIIELKLIVTYIELPNLFSK